MQLSCDPLDDACAALPGSANSSGATLCTSVICFSEMSLPIKWSCQGAPVTQQLPPKRKSPHLWSSPLEKSGLQGQFTETEHRPGYQEQVS